MKNQKANSTEKTAIINAFSIIATIFFAVYGLYYLFIGDYLLGYIYIAIFAGVITNLIIFRMYKTEMLALNVLASLGLPVLIPWQISGGVGDAGLFWYFIYVVWLFFLLGRVQGLVWIITVSLVSVGEFVLQYLGYLPTPYSIATMMSFYFGIILETAVLYVSQSTKEKADRQLTDERTKLQGILDNMSEGVEAADLSGNYIFFNKAAQEMLGVDVGKNDASQLQKFYKVFRPDKITLMDEEEFPITKALRGERTQVEQYIKSKHLKKGIHVLAKGSPLRDLQGKVVGGITIFSDITDNKEAEAKLLRAKAKDEAILSSIGDGVVAIDDSGDIVLFNYAAQIMTGVLQSEAIGKHYEKVLAFYNEKDKQDTDFVAVALSGKRSDITHNSILKRRDGTVIETANSAAPIVDMQGDVDGAVIVFRDITRERQIEHMKDEFLAVASHELRTPMGAVRANLAMILDGDYGPVNKDLIEPLKDMKSSTIRLVELVNDLLNVARIEAGRMLFTLNNFDITKAARDVVTSLAPLGKEKSVQVTLRSDNKHHKVQADLAKVKQVLTNLIGNSLKFTDKGSVTVNIDAKKDMIEVSVSDTGIGIAADDQKMLFTKFNQVTPLQSTKPTGTGLGLYISREIIRKMGGDLWLEKSVVDKGSTFTLTLPHAESPKAQKAKRKIKQEAAHHPDQK